jgi:hypothetical protein
MSTKNTIKVIKRGDRDKQKSENKKAKDPGEATKESARDMVSNVSNWVHEFQHRRRTETKQAFKTLFPDPPRPSEA